ncbi:MFS transporter [Amycolatopsis sp.]|uniref:MFS transporter n=1 Tax=Amycolatopsis sp. TaxID=37632 RepID=UPI002E0731FD|nr:MFS transporter [Amycolatopsis sp.]
MSAVQDAADTTSVAQKPVSRTRALIASSFGNTIETLDFAVYGLVAVNIGATFFPATDQTAQLLTTFAVVAMTYFVRPLGAVIFGSLADRIGRKRVMVIVLLMMSAATMLVGVLPGYAAIGIAAPVLLIALRALQSLSSGGEFGSISSYMLEQSSPRRRGLTTSWVMSTSVLGFLLGLIIIAVLHAVLTPASMNSWGWRLPFLIAGPLGVIGLYIRSKLDETQEFKELQARGRVAKAPLVEVLKYWRDLLRTTGIAALIASSFYMMIAFMLTYVGTTAQLGAGTALASTLIGGTVAMVTTPFMGLLSDTVGRKWILVGASASLLVLAVPLFALIRSSAAGAMLGQAVFGLLVGCLISAAIAAMTEVFPTHVRATASSVSYMLGTAVFGGTAPLIATYLVKTTGSTLSPAYYLMGTALIGLVASLTYPRRQHLADRERFAPARAAG